MLNFDLMSDQDRREAAAIERRRALDEERKKRIFNPKYRISLDYAALDEQVEQKRKQKEEERQRDIQFEEQLAQYSEISKELEKQEKTERKKLAQEINTFRLNFQKLQDRREYDLNDPNTYKAIPARLYDDDPRCGVSSAQKFEGEDLYSKERAAIQREQLKAFLDQQTAEKEAAEKDRIDAENAYKAALMARDQRAVELSNLENECRKRLNKACSEYNRALADERAFKDAEKSKQELQDTMAHKYNVLMSDMMLENVDTASNLGPNRKVATQFKGMTAAQKANFIAAQKAQILEGKEKKLQEKRLEQDYDEYVSNLQKTICAMDNEIARQQRQLNKQVAEENKRLSIEQKNHQQYLKRIVYTNKPTAAYYDQFNRTAR
ncbi:PREDICTED: RIB43A-like with coiled-coils protein 2 [Nicrophorus vespilloides]|uniref:RIB43A-like with coiled-coils protein 2 n=1 Tax=Nicrophorus vespilloides TaxID=110193 RepID=A0ABM1MMI4_NICVS|nr:PREDICTED: RIB43A-like with coiled-coils protein 2 [Nicrophorus vespilloides]